MQIKLILGMVFNANTRYTDVKENDVLSYFFVFGRAFSNKLPTLRFSSTLHATDLCSTVLIRTILPRLPIRTGR